MPGNKLKEQTKTKLQRKGEAYMSLAKSALTSDSKLQLYYNKSLVAAVKKVMDRVNMLCTPDKNGKCPVLTENDLRELKDGYKGIVNAAGFLESESLKKLGRKSALYLVSSKISKMAAQDLASIRKFRPELNLSFTEQMLAANTQLIQVDDQKQKIMGANMSIRQAMSAVVRNGDQKVAMRGLFTEKNMSKDPVPLFNSFFADYLKNNNLDERSEVAKAIADLRKVHDAAYPTIADVLNGIAIVKQDDKTYVQIHEKLEGNPKFQNWKNQHFLVISKGEKQVNPAFLEMLKQYRKSNDENQVRTALTNIECRIRIGSRLDLRNSAMSAVADLIGMEDIIAKSVPMAIRKDGKIIEGNFMAFAKGVDVKNMGAGNDFEKMDLATLNGNVAVMKQTANLQILDFICGNADRHMGNIFYQFDEQHRMTGIQGIDNDASFGIINQKGMKGETKVKNFRALKELNFIPQETAAALRLINPEMLRAALQRYGLQKDEIDAACDRFKMLNRHINSRFRHNSPQEFSRLLGNQELSKISHENIPWVYVLNDDQIRCISPFTHLTEGNLYRGVCKIAKREHNLGNNITEPKMENDSEWKRKMDDYKQMIANHKDELDLPENEIITREQREIDLPELADKISRCLGTLDEKNQGVFHSSQEYSNIRHYARIAVEAIRNAQDLNPVYTMMENLDALCTVYLDTKKADSSLKKNERSAERAMAVQKLQDLLKNRMEKMAENDHDCYCRLSAIERAGTFRKNTDTAAIASSIEQMENTLRTGGKLTSEQLNLNGIFDGITRTAWQHMTDHYHNEIVRMTNELKNAKGLPPSVKDRAAALVNAGSNLEPSSEKMNQIRTELKKFRTAAENYQKTLLKRTMHINGRDEVILRNDQVKGLSILNQLIGLSEKAEQGSVKPADTKTRLASMILQKKTSTTNDPGTLQYLTNYNSFRNEVKDLAAKSESDLRRQCKELRINVTAENLLVQAPALR